MKYTKEEFIEAVRISNSIKETLDKLGYREGLLEPRCEICKIENWNDQDLDNAIKKRLQAAAE